MDEQEFDDTMTDQDARRERGESVCMYCQRIIETGDVCRGCMRDLREYYVG